MTRGNFGRLIAAIAFPILLLHWSPAQCQTRTEAVRMNHISVIAEGAGPPVVLIPGLSSPRAVWDGQAAALAAKHRVFLVQINGFGGDDPGANLKPGVLDGVVADLDAFIVREKLGRPAIVGHSLGGLATLMFAKAHPEHVSRAMLVGCLPFYGMVFGPTATPAAIQPQAAAMRDKLAASFGKPDPAGAAATADHLALDPDSRAKVKAWVLAADQRVAAEAVYEDLQTDLRGDLAGIATPITVVYSWSEAGPKPVADAIYKGAYAAAPHVTYVDIGAAGHFIMLDQPEPFLRALLAFAG